MKPKNDSRGLNRGKPTNNERGLSNELSQTRVLEKSKEAAQIKSSREPGWVARAIKKPSPLTGVKRRLPIIGTVIHATKGGPAKRLVNNLSNDDSWHFTISRGGKIYQHVSLMNTAAHAGRSRLFFKNRFVGGDVMNRRTIGVELANWLEVVKDKNVFRPYNHKLKKVMKEKSVKGIGDTIQIGQARTATGEILDLYWEKYTDLQINSLKFLLGEIAKAGHPQALSLIGHEQISPKRKVDPGPAFPFDRLNDWAYQKFVYFSTR